MATGTNEMKEIETKVRSVFGNKPVPAFHPLAYYDSSLDCIRVVIRDCSFTEQRIDGIFTVLLDNYPEGDEQPYVGFTIKGAQHLCARLGLPTSGVIKVSDLLNRIVESYPEGTVGLVYNTVARPMVNTYYIEDVDVTVDEPKAATA